MLKEEVDEEDIAKLVSKWTGIPTGRLLEGEAQKLVRMEERLRQRGGGTRRCLSHAFRMQFAAVARVFPTRNARSAHLSFWDRRASAKPNSLARSLNFSSTTKS